MTDTTQNNENTQPTVEELQAEVERLRSHSAELLTDLKAERKAHKDTQAALQASKGGEDGAWKARYYQAAVLDVLERELTEAAAVPAKYLQDICAGMGLLTMEDDAEGLSRPVWRDQNGEPANFERGLYGFLSEVYRTTNNQQLGMALRATGTTGSGARGGSFRAASPAADADKAPQSPAQPAQYGLR